MPLHHGRGTTRRGPCADATARGRKAYERVGTLTRMLRSCALVALLTVGPLLSGCGPDLRVAGRDGWLDGAERLALAEEVKLDWRAALTPSDVVAALSAEPVVDVAVVPRHLVPQLLERELLLALPEDLTRGLEDDLAGHAVPVAAALVGVDTPGAGGVEATRWSDWLSDASALDTTRLEPRLRLGLGLLASGAYPDSRQDDDLRRAAEFVRDGAGASVTARVGGATTPAETLLLELALVVPSSATDPAASFARVRQWSSNVTLAPGWVRPGAPDPRDWGGPVDALARQARLWRVTRRGVDAFEAERRLETR